MKFSLLDFIVEIAEKLVYLLLSLLVFIIDSVNRILDKKFGINLYHDRRLVENYLLSVLGASKVALLKEALKKFNLHYEDMFYLAEDLRIYDYLDVYIDYKGTDAFSSYEKAIIKEATDFLNGAPREVTDQIIGFCFC